MRASASTVPAAPRSSLVANAALLLGTQVLTVAALVEVVARFVFPAPLAWKHPQLRYRPDPCEGDHANAAGHALAAQEIVRMTRPWVS